MKWFEKEGTSERLAADPMRAAGRQLRTALAIARLSAGREREFTVNPTNVNFWNAEWEQAEAAVPPYVVKVSGADELCVVAYRPGQNEDPPAAVSAFHIDSRGMLSAIPFGDTPPLFGHDDPQSEARALADGLVAGGVAKIRRLDTLHPEATAELREELNLPRE